MSSFDYDLFVIGGGSGGVRAARLAGSSGKRVALAEEYRMGGTCVIRGCVPKKLFTYAAACSEEFEDASGFGWTFGEPRFDWQKLVSAKNSEILRLEGLYQQGLENNHVKIYRSRAVFVDAHTLLLDKTSEQVTAEKILIATGGRPWIHDFPGNDLCISSNEVFDLETLPESILIVGGGYIAVEFANIFHGLGVETTLLLRRDLILRRFDSDLRKLLQEAMISKGIHIICNAGIDHIVKRGRKLVAALPDGREMIADQVMLALGRVPSTDNLGLDRAGVAVDKSGAVIVDSCLQTNIGNIWAVGDVTNRIQLTPVAIHEAMCFLKTAFEGKPTEPDYDLIATAVFSRPEIGTLGLSEEDAAQKFPHVEVYRTVFRPMRHTVSGRDERMLLKLVVDRESRIVLGVHIFGLNAGEMVQLLGIALKGKLTKDVFDSVMAVHPTVSEEFVTMYSPSYYYDHGKRTDD